MALLTVLQLCTYIRGTASDDGTLGELRTEALGLFAAELGRPIEAGGTFGESQSYAVTLSARYGGAGTAVTTGSAGLGALTSHPGYATWIEPILNGALRAMVSHWAQNRNPGASAESSGGDSVSYFEDGLPPRVVSMLKPLKGLSS